MAYCIGTFQKQTTISVFCIFSSHILFRIIYTAVDFLSHAKYTTQYADCVLYKWRAAGFSFYKQWENLVKFLYCKYFPFLDNLQDKYTAILDAICVFFSYLQLQYWLVSAYVKFVLESVLYLHSQWNHWFLHWGKGILCSVTFLCSPLSSSVLPFCSSTAATLYNTSYCQLKMEIANINKKVGASTK